jgi:hypothetical protein
MTSLSRILKFAVGAGIVVILFISPITIMLRRYGVNNQGIDVLVWIGYLGLAFLSFIFTFLVIRDVFCLPTALLNTLKRRLPETLHGKSDPAIPENPSHRGFLVNSMNYGIMATASLTTGYGIVEAKRVPEVKEVQIPIPALPGEFDGFRIVQVTDLHVSPTIRRPYVEKVVKIVNSLNADIFALTGDLVDGTIRQLSHDVAPLKNIQSAHGNFFVTGNPECMVCGYDESCPMSALPWIFGDDTKVTPDKFSNVEDQTETWEKAKILGKEIPHKSGEQMRM